MTMNTKKDAGAAAKAPAPAPAPEADGGKKKEMVKGADSVESAEAKLAPKKDAKGAKGG